MEQNELRTTTQYDLLVLLVILFQLIACTTAVNSSAPSSSLHTRGNPAAEMSLVMFLDFQDEDAKLAWNTIKSVLHHYGEESLFFTLKPLSTFNNRQSSYICFSTESIYNNLLLPSGYWDVVDFFLSKSTEFSNELYENKTALQLMTHLREYAKLFINTSIEEYDQDSLSPEVFNTIRNNIIEATSYGFYKSPSYLINGAAVTLPYSAPVDKFVVLLETKNETAVGIDLSATSCKVYWGFMIIFMATSVGMLILLLVVCINSRFKSLRQDLFDPTKMWETVTVPEIPHQEKGSFTEDEVQCENNQQDEEEDEQQQNVEDLVGSQVESEAADVNQVPPPPVQKSAAG